jgi:hypothetical protein
MSDRNGLVAVIVRYDPRNLALFDCRILPNSTVNAAFISGNILHPTCNFSVAAGYL